MLGGYRCGVIVMWALWTSRCVEIIQGGLEALVETIKIVWSELVHSLKEEQGSMQG